MIDTGNVICPICKTDKNIIHKRKHNKYDILYCSCCDFQFSFPMESVEQKWYEESPIYRLRDAELVNKEKNSEIISKNDWRIQRLITIFEQKRSNGIKKSLT